MSSTIEVANKDSDDLSSNLVCDHKRIRAIIYSEKLIL